MIPITPYTNVSIEKTARLLQNLVDLESNRNVHLPDHIGRSLDDLLKAQQTFLQRIDEYMHERSSFEREDSIEVVSTIVETCPEFLATTDMDGRLPCRVAAHKASSSSHRYLLMFAEVGCHYNIGGEESRGGLLTPTNHGHNALHFIRDPKVFDVLQNHNPPLFYTKDIQKKILIHIAARKESLELVKYLCNLDPACIFQENSHNGLPIHCAIKRHTSDESKSIVQYLLKQSVSYSVTGETVGGLFTKMPDSDEWALDAMVEKWGRKDAWDCIERALSKIQNVHKMPILHQTLQHTPQYFAEVINRFSKQDDAPDM